MKRSASKGDIADTEDHNDSAENGGGSKRRAAAKSHPSLPLRSQHIHAGIPAAVAISSNQTEQTTLELVRFIEDEARKL